MKSSDDGKNVDKVLLRLLADAFNVAFKLFVSALMFASALYRKYYRQFPLSTLLFGLSIALYAFLMRSLAGRVDVSLLRSFLNFGWSSRGLAGFSILALV